MKTFITIIVAAFMLTNNYASATAPETTKRSNVAAINFTLDLYANAVSKGQVDGIEQLFSEQFHQRYSSKKRSYIFNKAQLVGFLKSHRNLQQNCETDYSIIEESKGVAIAKVAMKYKTFCRVDYVTISLSSNGYQISQIVSTFE
jgi:hypothetical protein